MAADWDTGKEQFADFLAKRQSGLNNMYLQNVYEQNRARKEAQDAAKPSLGKFLSGALPGLAMGALVPGAGLGTALAMGLGGGLSGSGMFGQELRGMTPSLLNMAGMAAGKYHAGGFGGGAEAGAPPPSDVFTGSASGAAALPQLARPDLSTPIGAGANTFRFPDYLNQPAY